MPWIPTKEGDRMEDLLTIRDLSISYEKHVTVDHVSLSLKPGEALSVVGESGCGKSTILRALMHVLPDNGKIEGGSLLYRGKDIYRLSPEEWRQVTGRRMVMLFQQPGSYLDPIRTIGKQFNDFLRAHGVSSVDCRPLALGILERAGLPEGERILSSYAFQLSGGMRQKVAASMILALSPELIVMDEPTSALDVVTQERILHLIRKEWETFHFAGLFVSHDLAVVQEITDRVLVMEQGHVVERLLSKDLRKGLHPCTRRLISAQLPEDGHSIPSAYEKGILYYDGNQVQLVEDDEKIRDILGKGAVEKEVALGEEHRVRAYCRESDDDHSAD